MTVRCNTASIHTDAKPLGVGQYRVLAIDINTMNIVCSEVIRANNINEAELYIVRRVINSNAIVFTDSQYSVDILNVSNVIKIPSYCNVADTILNNSKRK